MRNATSNLGTAIKAARKNKQLTQLELSEELGITPRHLQAIENENKTPSYDLLSRMLSLSEAPLIKPLSVLMNTLPFRASRMVSLKYAKPGVILEFTWVAIW